MKHTQHDLVTLALAQHQEWRRAYELEKQFVGNEMIGSEADTRLYELFDKQTPDKGETIRKIDGDTYTIETKKEKGERWWRAYLSEKKPVYVSPTLKKMVKIDGEWVWREVNEKGELIGT